MSRRILVVEDEDAIRQFEVINLQRGGYETVEAVNGFDALTKFEEEYGNFQVVLLDIMMPGIDGMEVCRTIRARSSTVGIIMLTAKSQEVDKISGLMLGADDYITKPFSPSELLVRVDALCRRMEMQATGTVNIVQRDEIVLGNFTLNLRRRTLHENGRAIVLTQVEFQILECLFTAPEVPLSRSEILKRVWGDTYLGEEKIVDVNVRRLRMKIEDDPSVPRHLVTVWGKGYKWVV